jgi:hypothetical protein
MRLHAIAGAALCALIATNAPANAAVVTYTYAGLPLHATETGGWWEDTLDGYSGQMIIDEKELGHSLKNATVTFDLWAFFNPHWEFESPGLILFDIFPWLEPDMGVGGSITFTTNESREIIDWFSWFMAGPPDGGLSTEFDWYDSLIFGAPYLPTPTYPGTGVADYFSEGPGTWTVEVSPVPIPGALALFLTGLAGFGLFGWFRRRTGEPA